MTDVLATVGVAVALVAALALAVRRPLAGAAALVVGLAVAEPVLASVRALGLDDDAVRLAGSWKEVVAAGLVLAAVRATPRPVVLDALDRVALLYLGIVAAYAAAGGWLVGGGTGTDIGVQGTLVGARTNAAFVVLLVVARRLPVGRGELERLVRLVVAVGVAVAAVTALEAAASEGWNRFAVERLEVPAYRTEVLDTAVRNPLDVRVYSASGDGLDLRAGGLQFDPLTTGFSLVVPLLLAADRALRRPTALPWVAAVAATGTGIVLTQTRAAVVAAAVGLVVLLVRPRGDELAGRRRLAIAAGALVVAAAVPVLLLTDVGRRGSEAAEQEDSDALHGDRTSAALRDVVRRPAGRGLGSGATVGNRFGSTNGIVAENTYLQVASETGLVSGLALLGLTGVAAGLALGRSAARSGAIGAALVGLACGGVFLQVWAALAVAWPAWLVLGLSVGAPPDRYGGDVLAPATAATWVARSAR